MISLQMQKQGWSTHYILTLVQLNTGWRSQFEVGWKIPHFIRETAQKIKQMLGSSSYDIILNVSGLECKIMD